MSKWGEQLTLFGKNGFPQPSPGRILDAQKTALRIARSRGIEVYEVRWKSNRRVMASVGKNGTLNLHKIYQRAKDTDLRALANVLSGRSSDEDRERFHKFIEKHLPRVLGEGRTRLVVMPPRGLFHDLERALVKVLPLLGKRLRPMPKVGWSPARVGRRGITWGTHRDTPVGPLILVNAVLDAPDIPTFVVEHIVWHELCHQAAPPFNGSNGRRQVHGREFRELEERFRRLSEAEMWEEKHVVGLIRRHYPRRYGR
jgi:predicted SprT family Zn-dependent metalloprotease